eukprot:6136655-Pyramimonas_sp.AAC.1
MFSSGKQLITRCLALPARLPQVDRPRQRAAPGSKTQVQKQDNRIKLELAAEKRREHDEVLFGDLWPETNDISPVQQAGVE